MEEIKKTKKELILEAQELADKLIEKLFTEFAQIELEQAKIFEQIKKS